MSFNIDSFIFVAFLVVNLVFGLWSSRGIKTIKEYAVGDGKFSTATIAATIVATWVSGEFFYTNVTEAYRNGLNFIWVAILGNLVCLMSIGVFFAPRMGEFLGKLSIAEAMGDLFGNKVRVITSISGFIGAAGMISIQLKMAGLMFEYALGMTITQGTIVAAIIITLYSSLGGIKSVTFTDVIQFLTFAVIVPVIAYVLLDSVDSIDTIFNTITNNPQFDYKKVFNFLDYTSLEYLLLFLFFSVPDFPPAIFQRVAMAKNTNQVRYSFIIASVTCVLFICTMNWMGVLALSINPNLDPSRIVEYVVFDSAYVGLKGAIVAGVMAMIMSTIDSYINSTAVLIVHDLFNPMKIRLLKNELLSARAVSLSLGVFGLILSLREGRLLELIIVTYSLYLPIVTVPFIMAILGFRSTEKSVILGMIAGLCTVILWDYIFVIKIGNSIPAGMLSNLVVLISSHYIFKQKGGWVGIKDESALKALRYKKKLRFKRYVHQLRSFDFIKICRANCPRGEGAISILGLFVMVSAFSSFVTLPKECKIYYGYLIDVLYPISLLSSSILISYPLWLPRWKKGYLISLVWNITMFIVLICSSFLMVLVSHFSEIQLITFMVNLVVISTFANWKWSISSIALGIVVVEFCCHSILQLYNTENSLILSNFKVIYLLLLITGVIILFLKPKQYHQELTEEKNKHLNGRIVAKDKEVQEALALKGEFIRNVQHEYHTPMTGIISLSEGMLYAYDKLTDEEKREYLKDIVQNSHKLQAFDENITTLSLLSKPHYKLEREDTALNDLIYERVQICKKLYDQDNDDREFALDLENNVVVSADKSYIIQLLDNLLINAIQYCKNGLIKITLSDDKINAVFTVSDEGIGIPKLELFEIFDPFTVSSKTRTPSGGRGVGLAVCRRIAEVHGGEITAESDGKKGAKFTVKLPLHKR